MSCLDYSLHLYSKSSKDTATDESLRNLYFSCYEGKISNTENNMHWHDFFEIIYVEKGEAKISGITDEIIVKENESVFLNSDFLHAVQNCNPNKPCQISSIVAHPYFVTNLNENILFEKYIKKLIMNKNIQYKKYTKDSTMNDLVKYGINQAKKDEVGYEYDIKYCMAKIISDIDKNMDDEITDVIKESNHVKEIRCRLMLDYIHKNYYKQIDLQDISHSAMISNSECLRCFRSVLNQSPIQYLRDYRLRVARHFLIETNHSISTICFLTGFQDISYFSRSFKQKYSYSPKDYRNSFLVK